MSELVEIHLHGALATEYGECHKFQINSVRQGIRAMTCQFKGFRKRIASASWHVFSNRRSINKDEIDLMGARRIDIYPKLKGAGGGIVKAIAGVALVAVGFVTGQPWLVSIGVSVALGGISEMLAPSPRSPNYGQRQDAASNQSYYFDGPSNKAAVGLAVPVIYGIMLVGSISVSQSLNVES